ncbi:ANKRD17 [Symbiodinium microadriaticum]|nr:ANKRD17 [Symbiodinium microadriaticum]
MDERLLLQLDEHEAKLGKVLAQQESMLQSAILESFDQMRHDLKAVQRLHPEPAPESLSEPNLLSQLNGTWQPHASGDDPPAMSPVPSLPSEHPMTQSMVVTFPPEVDSPGSVSSGHEVDAANVFRNVTDLTAATEHEQNCISLRWIRLLDYIAAALVILNTIALIFELELEGKVSACSLGLVVLLPSPHRSSFVEWPWKEAAFGTASQRVSYQGLKYRGAGQRRRILDFVICKKIRARDHCQNRGKALDGFHDNARFYVLLQEADRKACQSFASSLCWSMVLLLIFIIVGALVIGNILQDFIQDQSANLEDRQWIWHHYGTAYRSWLTLYEVTFAGSWPTRTRPVLDKVSQGFAIFFVLYITVIAFALIRIITAIFLKDTLDAANNDAELQIMENMARRERFVRHLQGIFRAIDDTGDGMITQKRLEKVLSNPKVRAYFQTLDLDITESTALFHLLDDGDGEVTLHEFISGILRCKGHARAIDQVALHTDIRMLDKKVSRLGEVLLSSSPSGRKSDVVSARHLRDSHAELLCMFRTKSNELIL